MPQREFWTERVPVEVRWRYWCDATEPEGPSQLSCTVYDQAGQMMEHASASIPWNVTYEAVDAMLKDTWQGYLFGERHDGPRALKRAESAWRKLAKSWRPVAG